MLPLSVKFRGDFTHVLVDVQSQQEDIWFEVRMTTLHCKNRDMARLLYSRPLQRRLCMEHKFA